MMHACMLAFLRGRAPNQQTINDVSKSSCSYVQGREIGCICMTEYRFVDTYTPLAYSTPMLRDMSSSSRIHPLSVNYYPSTGIKWRWMGIKRTKCVELRGGDIERGLVREERGREGESRMRECDDRKREMRAGLASQWSICKAFTYKVDVMEWWVKSNEGLSFCTRGGMTFLLF